jgi:phosphatidylglycerol lysyltransferase
MHEGLRHWQRLKWVPKLVGFWIPALLPHIFALMTLVCGAVLLFSAVTPAVTNRMEWLADIIPLPVLEASHFISSLVGMALVLLARGLQRRLDAAWLLTTALLVVGIMVSLLKGADYEEASFLAVLLLGLLPCRRRFYRKSSLISQRFTAGWLATIAVVFICTAWLCLFAYQHVEYSHDLWWQFSFTEGDAPRSLRALVGTVGLTLLIAGAKLLQSAPTALVQPTTAELEQARSIIAACRQTYPHLALLGDKSLLFNASKNGFVMYGAEGRSWICMGDPVGPADEKRELAWAFRELCEYYDGWTVFYQVQPENLDLYLELGLDLLKIGEEARVPLAELSLEGKSRRSLRGTVNKLEREGYGFAIVPPQAVGALLPRLRQVSDAWLGGKNAREKGFSLGFFKEEYLKTCPLALVRRDERIVAFANLWLSSAKEELSIDLMRYVPDAPNGIMDYLFIRLMLWGKEQGYAWFNLGMAPLAGLESRTLAPLWNRFGALVFGHGERFYNFQGLRQYKDKFDPRWEPRYLAVPNGFVLPRVLVNISALIARGLKGIIKK